MNIFSIYFKAALVFSNRLGAGCLFFTYYHVKHFSHYSLISSAFVALQAFSSRGETRLLFAEV